MNNSGFSDGFDTLVGVYTRQMSFGLEATRTDVAFDEYEKSFFLTKAQEELVLSLYNGRNSSGRSFEETEELRRYLSPLVKDATLEPEEGVFTGIHSNSKFFNLPEDLWFITYEAVNISDGKCEGNNSLEVVPATHDEYNRLRKNPFRGPNDRRALRLDLSDNTVEVISKYTISSYYLRYIKKLSPIILIDLPDGLEIAGETEETECILPESLHQRILEDAVIKALQSKGYSVNNNK